MTRKRRRMTLLAAVAAASSTAAALVLLAAGDGVVYFYGPSQLAEAAPPPERRFRIGGIVEEGSVARADDGVTVRFRVTDRVRAVPVAYAGLLPDLFREGQGVVAGGRLDGQGVFRADEILAKHDETYMPPEVADALRAAGRWRGGATVR